MTEVMFGKIRVKVRKAEEQREPGFVEYLADVDAPGVEPFTFHTVKESSMMTREVARGLMMLLLESWMRPAEFVTRRIRQAIEYAENLEESEEIGKRVRIEAVDTAKFAALLDPFMNDAHEALWRMSKVQKWGDLPVRGPREWLPGRKQG